MIESLIIKNFKSHLNSEFKIGAFNLFAGKNGMGKSTILQSLLLLRQSYLQANRIDGILLNGDLVMIGNSQDAFCEFAEGDFLELLISDAGEKYDWQFERNLDKNFLPAVKKNDFGKLSGLSLFGKNFQYISAEHQAAKHVHARNSYYVEQLNQISEKFGDCKYTVHYLSTYSRTPLLFPKIAHPNETSLDLIDQVNAWLSEISPGIKVNIKEDPSQNTLLLTYNYKTKFGPTHDYKPENVGFGISYILPILVATLSAKENSIILIENPEAHLHPGGQAALGKLLCRAAECGIQFFIETHSDHIFNSILVNILEEKRKEGSGIQKEKVSIYFIDKDNGSQVSVNHPILIRDDARIVSPPEFFFDQFSKDMKSIMGF